MRIALPYNTHFGEYSTDIFTGGIEKFCYQIDDTFDDVHIINIDNNEPIKENTTKIKNFAKDINADIIISNWHQASFSGAKILDSEIPIMFINHGVHALGSVLRSMDRIRHKNHSCYMVSKCQHEAYRVMAKRMKHPNDVMVDGYIDSSYVEGDKPELLDIEYDCCTIGRCDPVEKKPFLLKKWLQGLDYNTVLMTNTPTDEKELRYLHKNSHWDGVVLDLKHSDVMKTLSKSANYFSTCQAETWGITALESLSHGVPLILNSKNGTHASTGLCDNESFYTLVSTDLELVTALNLSGNIDRREIQDSTWDKHQHDNWKRKFINAVDTTIEKHRANIQN